MNHRELFFRHLAQTSDEPLAWEISKAEGACLWDATGKSYLDLIGGISVCHVGHRHPRVLQAIAEQAEHYLHVMVYGELIQSPQVQYAELLARHLPASLQQVYFTNSGAEAIEGAMKLAKRYTGRPHIFCFHKSYHGSTQGALSLLGDEYWRQAYRPLLPGIFRFDYNENEVIEQINEQTACVVLETIQAEAGVVVPDTAWMQALADACKQNGALLILDEVQCGFGRNGTLWAFEQFGVVPDILVLGKALGGGLPLGAFIASAEIMQVLTHYPVLGHITTFGGHPLCCAAGKAAMEVLLEERLWEQVYEKEKLFHHHLQSLPGCKIRSRGMMIAIEFESAEINKQIIRRCWEKGVFTDWYLFAPHCMRIVPPLIISYEQIQQACEVIRDSVREVLGN
ncbi:aspartate aminotransferase family protein [Thermoflavifilum thermophilum]|uniref:Acetylornithine/succinyldiaminopimelate/putrescine aminotransferase n=1 Tax=Thermoflavifilum thermophilum TaxID=1393122 RepID=A0A1I7N8I0_9BACT|nr:aspartate aminotransferase family protein [Thermoflavifilum thermophilum]SFV30948.1 Acetylornithine/succinyldiaminopimelate/putrescine aminotransferase [Thermoflavifilum thermophilum]